MTCTRTESLLSKKRARLRAEIIKGLKSGPGIPITPDYWKKKRALIKRTVSRRK